MKNKKRNFLGIAFLSSELFILFLKAIFAGIIQAIFAFFTKNKLEDWKSKKKSIDD